MAIVLVDGQEVELGNDERLNGIQVAQRIGVDVPHYCWHPGLSVVASCRMCLVETGLRHPETGKISMLPKLVPACQTPAKDGTVIVTDSEKVRQGRAFVQEALLLDHPIDCPVCDKAGECVLQDYHFQYGQKERRADLRPFSSRRRPVGPAVTLFVDRCVMCTLCTRFTREVTGTAELMVVQRGSRAEIDVFPGYPLTNKLSGNVVDLCPVGALGDKDFLYQQRVWDMKKHPGVCCGCSTGCSIVIEENQDHVYRLKPRTNPHINQWWICDEGRYGFHHIHSEKRHTLLLRRKQDTTDPSYDQIQWSELVRDLNERLSTAGRLAAVLSPHLTVEEAYLLAKYIRSLDPEAFVVLGPVPTKGEDEVVGLGPRGNHFTIRAEKCPNRRGVEQIVAHFSSSLSTGAVRGFEELVRRIDAGEVGAAWISGGYKTDWINEQTASRFERLELLILQDLFDSPLWQRATYRLPGAAFAERDGSYVNFADRLQSCSWAIRPPAGVRVEGSLIWELLGRQGMYHARSILDEIADEIMYFSAVAGPVPPVGVDLKINLLASTS